MNTPTYPAHVAYTETLPPPLPDGYIRYTGGAFVPVQVVGGDVRAPDPPPPPGACWYGCPVCPVCAELQQEGNTNATDTADATDATGW